MDAHAMSEFHPEPVGTDRESLKRSIANRLLYTVGKDPHAAHPRDWLTALAHVVRDRLVERWMATTRAQYQQDVKRVYYFSVEYLIGRALTNGLLALGVYDDCRAALAEMGIELSQLEALEEDAALGNGGLGRLAACFLDSMATLDLPGFGYGIRYDYGMFAQAFKDGWQVEHPDHWLAAGNPWEFPRSEVVYPVKFGGRVERRDGVAHWVDSDDVLAMAYDTIVPGYGTHAVNTLRLWSAKSTRDIDLAAFNRGHYSLAVEAKNRSENVSRVLYPDDSSAEGRELRLRQEYFFVSASLQDILRRFRSDHQDWDLLPDKAAVHLNDTHPALAVPELMRLLTDVHGLPWDQAWALSGRVFSYTNHTLMPEALETWPTELLGQVLPRILEIILKINGRFLEQVSETPGADLDLLSQVSLIEEDGQQRARMGHLSVLASHKINGVSAIHSGLVRDTLFADFARLYPERFVNVTNGVTPRRWLNQANPELAALIDTRIGGDWRVDLDRLGDLAPLAADPELGAAFRAIKTANKTRLAKLVAVQTGVILDPASLFDVHVKRIHEYKRQLLNLLQVIARYNRIKAAPEEDWVPRSVIFAGKAASAYWMAKLIIKLINDVARTVNADPEVDGRLKIAFVPNYSVSAAGMMTSAAELSEQISTAGTEASGTGNMKLALNGALTIGTEDGANIEILDAVAKDNIFIFGLSVDQVAQLRRDGYDPSHYYDVDSELKRALEQIAGGHFSPEQPDRFKAIVDALTVHGDHYLVLADFADYMACQDRVDQAYRDPADWTRRAILNVAAMGHFSSDRAIRTYAETVWSVEPLKL
jgi:starch phosphorylase